MEHAERLQHRCEVLAAMCVAGTGSLLLFGYLQSAALAVATEEATLGRPSAWELVEGAAAGGLAGSPVSFYAPSALALLVLAHVLVTLVGPGEVVGRLGTRVLQLVCAAGTLVALGAVIATGAVARRGGVFEGIQTGEVAEAERDWVLTALDRTGIILPIAVCGVGAAYTAWCAWRALEELPDVDDGPPPGLDAAAYGVVPPDRAPSGPPSTPLPGGPAVPSSAAPAGGSGAPPPPGASLGAPPPVGPPAAWPADPHGAPADPPPPGAAGWGRPVPPT